MILDGQSKRIIAQTHLLDDVVSLTPGFDFEAIAQSIDCLVMGAVYAIEAMGRRAIRAQWLDVMVLHLRRIVAGNVETKGAAKRDIKELHALADCEDRQAPFERIFRRFKFPAIALRLHV